MSKLFTGGVPTGPDIERLIKEITVESGTAVSYADIEIVISTSSSESRFRTVTTAWRKRLFREKGLQSKAEGEAFTFLTAAQAVDLGMRNMHRVGRAIGRVHTQVSAIDQSGLTEESRAKHGLLAREAQALLDHARRSAKAIAAPAPVSTTLRLARSQ